MMDPATLHLALDSLQRNRMAWLWVGVCVLIAWVLVGVAVLPVKAGVATSLVAVYFLGPVMSLTSVLLRETRFLPLTSRHVWVVAWLLSTLVSTVFIVALQAAGVGISLVAGFPQAASAESILFVALCVFAYGGSTVLVGPLVGYTTHAATERRPKWLWVFLAALMICVYFGGLVAPWALWSVLPTSFATLNGWSTAVLVVGIVASLGAGVWTPHRFGHAGRPTSNRPKARAGGAADVVPQGADRFTGLSRLLLPALAWVVAFAVAASVAAAGVALFHLPETLYQTFADWGLLPFSAAGLSSKAIVGTGMFVPFFVIGFASVWDDHTRHLRVLPLSTADTTRLFLVTGVMTWAVVWVVLLAMHLVVLGLRPNTLRPELFIYLAGMSALLQAALRTRSRSGGLFTLNTIVVFLMVGTVDSLSGRFGVTVMFWTHVTAGLMAFLIAAALTHRSLTRSTSSAHIYQPTNRPFNA